MMPVPVKSDGLVVTTKQVKVNEYQTETRYFAETGDGFDGTANGYGYKSMEKLRKAYWYHQNRGKINQSKSEARIFLKENPDVRKVLDEYFSADNMLVACKDGEELSFPLLIQGLESGDWSENGREIGQDIAIKIKEKKHLWKTLERGVEG